MLTLCREHDRAYALLYSEWRIAKGQVQASVHSGVAGFIEKRAVKGREEEKMSDLHLEPR
jgi:hypothetical protein